MMTVVVLLLVALVLIYLLMNSSLLIRQRMENKGFIRDLKRQVGLLADQPKKTDLQLVDEGQIILLDQRAVFIQLNEGEQKEANTAFMRLELSDWPSWLSLALTHERPTCHVNGALLPITPTSSLVFPSLEIEDWLHKQWAHFEVTIRNNRLEVEVELPSTHAKQEAKKLKAFLTQLPEALEVFCAQLPPTAEAFLEMVYTQNPHDHLISSAALYQLYCLNGRVPDGFSDIPVDHVIYILSLIPDPLPIAEQLEWSLAKWLTLIEAARNAREDVLNMLLHACPSEAVSVLSDYPKAMVPLLAHRWQAASDAQRMQFMTLVRSVSISDEDRAAWLTIISQAMPAACVYDDFGALMKQGEHEVPVAHALALVLQDNPALLTEHIWCEGVLAVMRGFDWDEAPWLAKALVERAPMRVFGLIHTTLQKSYFAVSPLGVELTKQKSAWQGKLKKQDGQLSLSADSITNGSLSLTEQGGTITQIESAQKNLQDADEY